MGTPTEPNGRLTALGNQLIEVHMWLREELDRLREDVDSYLDGGERPRDLRAHCLTFCSALSRHHGGEDGGVFPALADRVPELRPVLEELMYDHHVVAGILRSVEELLGDLTGDPGPAEAQSVRAELDGLAALLESHFGYEEKRLFAALNVLDAAGWDGSRSDFLLTDVPGLGVQAGHRKSIKDRTLPATASLDRLSLRPESDDIEGA